MVLICIGNSINTFLYQTKQAYKQALKCCCRGYELVTKADFGAKHYMFYFPLFHIKSCFLFSLIQLTKTCTTKNANLPPSLHTIYCSHQDYLQCRIIENECSNLMSSYLHFPLLLIPASCLVESQIIFALG